MEGPNRRQLDAIIQDIKQGRAAYHRFTAKVRHECMMFARHGIPHANYLPPLDKEATTRGDLAQIVSNVVLDPAVWRPHNARHRLNMLTLISLQANTGARPGELALHQGYSDALRWGDVDFFPCAWENRPNSNFLQAEVRIRCRKGQRETSNTSTPYQHPLYEDARRGSATDVTMLLAERARAARDASSA